VILLVVLLGWYCWGIPPSAACDAAVYSALPRPRSSFTQPRQVGSVREWLGHSQVAPVPHSWLCSPNEVMYACNGCPTLSCMEDGEGWCELAAPCVCWSALAGKLQPHQCPSVHYSPFG
jgi:hypothetical protein